MDNSFENETTNENNGCHDESHCHDGCCDENCCDEDCCDENCCCHDEEHATVTLTLNDDTKLECDVLGTFDVEGKEYIALVAHGHDEAFIYRYSEGENEEIELAQIESDEEFKMVSEVFYNVFADDMVDDLPDEGDGE